MKCPKCGYNSFEYYDTCKKCSSDLSGYKQTYSITSMVLPLEAKEKMAADVFSGEAATDQNSDVAEIHDDIFSFDLPADTSSAPAQLNDDPFNFDAPSFNAPQAESLKADDDIFADLLESTSQVPGSSAALAVTPPVAATTNATASANEFDLEKFSWDDTPVEAGATESNGSTSDFDSLFGETKDNSSK